MVGLKICVISSSSATFWNNSVLNPLPLSATMVSQPLMVANTCFRYACVIASTDLLGMGITMGYLVRRHIHFSIYELSLELGGWKGPTRSHAKELKGFWRFVTVFVPAFSKKSLLIRQYVLTMPAGLGDYGSLLVLW